MLAIATVAAALLALSATAEAYATKYDYRGRDNHGSYEPSYEHGVYGSEYDSGHGAYKGRDYSHESHYAEDDYREPYSEEPTYTYEQYHKPLSTYRHKRSLILEPLNQEVSPGCFSSPPQDCGAGCVASFREDEDCYQCCCMDKTVNATTCALPADGGNCRGNLERWAFNEETGDCEPFVYGGCGGNGNRFMCKEMCEHHCVEVKGAVRNGHQFDSEDRPETSSAECECQCSNLRTLTRRFGVPRFEGGCTQTNNNDQFCYVLPNSGSTCDDLQPSSKFRGLFFSRDACFTPGRFDPECRL